MTEPAVFLMTRCGEKKAVQCSHCEDEQFDITTSDGQAAWQSDVTVTANLNFKKCLIRLQLKFEELF